MDGTLFKERMSEFASHCLLNTLMITVQDVYCRGTCPGKSAEEFARETQLVFPYRGVYVRHVGQDQAVADANQVLFFNADDGYRVSHPVAGGDACLAIKLSEPLLHELAPRNLLCDGSPLAFRL